MAVREIDISQFADHLVMRDRRAATDMALSVLASGVSPGEVLCDLVGAALEQVGARWLRDELSVADEHGATAVADSVVSAVAARVQVSIDGPTVAVMCAEGEWHVLVARIVAETFRAAGCDVAFIGGSIPAAHFTRFLENNQFDAIAVSCSTPLALDGVLGMVHVAHDAEVPVVAGGRALGSTPTRARTLGADLWAPDAIVGADLLWDLPTRLREPTADGGGALEVAFHADDVVDAAMQDLAARFAPMASFTPHQLARTREDFEYIVRFARAAILTRDESLFDEFVEWLEQLLAARSLPPGTVLASLRSLTNAAARVPILAEAVERHVVRMRDAHPDQTRA